MLKCRRRFRQQTFNKFGFDFNGLINLGEFLFLFCSLGRAMVPM